MSQCTFPNCRFSASDKSGYCPRHLFMKGAGSSPDKNQDKKSDTKPVKKKQSRIPRKTKKLASKERQYAKMVREMAAESTECEIRVPGVCTGVMEGVHHSKGRGKFLLVRKYLKRACNPCHRYIETHPQYAMEHGFSVSRLTKE